MSQVAFEAADRLARGGSPSPGPEARLLVSHVLGVAPSELIWTDSVTAQQRRTIDDLVARRVRGEPVQYLTGVAYFRHVSVAVGPGVFIPRPETEELAGWVIAHLATRSAGSRRVVELCAGSGAISAAIRDEVGGVELYAVERAAGAYDYLERNLAGRGVTVLRADMADAFAELDGQVDVVVANPPYIPESHRNLLPTDVVDHEPQEALLAGPDGLDALRLVARVAARLLRVGGVVAAEHDESHAESVRRLMEDEFTAVETHKDLTGRPRFVTAVRVAGLGS